MTEKQRGWRRGSLISHRTSEYEQDKESENMLLDNDIIQTRDYRNTKTEPRHPRLPALIDPYLPDHVPLGRTNHWVPLISATEISSNVGRGGGWDDVEGRSCGWKKGVWYVIWRLCWQNKNKVGKRGARKSGVTRSQLNWLHRKTLRPFCQWGFVNGGMLSNCLPLGGGLRQPVRRNRGVKQWRLSACR